MTAGRLRRGNWSVEELQRLRRLLPRRGVADAARLLRRSPESVRRRALALFAGQARRAGWTPDDDIALRQSWGALEPRLLAATLARSVQEVQRRAQQLRAELRTDAWSRAEERLLKQLYGTRRDEDLEVCLQRPRSEIARVAARLCLSKDKRFAKVATAVRQRMPRWVPADVELLCRLYPERPNLEVARLLHRSVASVANKANLLGLRKSASLLARIGRANVAARYGASAFAAGP